MVEKILGFGNNTPSSFKRLEVRAPEVQDFSKVEDAPYREFALGIDVTFYDKLGNPESHLRANYAKELINEKRAI